MTFINNSQLTSYSTVQNLKLSSKISNKTMMSAFISVIRHYTGRPSRDNQMRKNKDIQFEKEELK